MALDSGQFAFIGVSVIVSAAPLLLYLFLVWFLDLFERGPAWLVLFTFLWGAFASTFVALVGEKFVLLLLESYPEVNPLALPVYFAPLIEELSKGIVLLYLFYRRAFNGPLHGIVYAAAVALGFAVTENFLYYTGIFQALGSPAYFRAIAERTLVLSSVHVFSTTMMGLGLGAIKISTRGLARTALAPLALAAGLLVHIVFNFAQVARPDLALSFVLAILVLVAGAMVWTLRREQNTIRAELARTLKRSELQEVTSLRHRLTGFLEAWHSRGALPALAEEEHHQSLARSALYAAEARTLPNPAERRELVRLAKAERTRAVRIHRQLAGMRT